MHLGLACHLEDDLRFILLILADTMGLHLRIGMLKYPLHEISLLYLLRYT